MNVPYSATKEDLFYPARRGAFFPDGRPASDAALCAEMARLAYARREPDFAFDQDQILKVTLAIGFRECKFFENPTGPQGQGSHGFLAIDDTAKLAVLSFRGTDADDPTDLIDDIEASLEPWRGIGKVHSGFAGALNQIWDKVETGLASVAGAKLLFTGHSLGAAMATLAASLQLPSSLHTFGSPRAGDAEFVAALEQRQFENRRYVDCCDVVTRVPPDGLARYTHIGRPFYIDLARAVQQRDPNDEYIEKDRCEAEVQYIENDAWRIGNVAVRPLADHAPINYVWPVSVASGA